MRMNLAGGLPPSTRSSRPKTSSRPARSWRTSTWTRRSRNTSSTSSSPRASRRRYNLQKLQNLIAYGGSPKSVDRWPRPHAPTPSSAAAGIIPEDVRAVCHDVLRHRIGLMYEAEAENITSEEIITDIR